MNTAASGASLVLHPADPEWTAENPDGVIDLLQQIGLAADKIAGEPDSYSAGEKFLELVAFMGCSPSISLAPDENSEHYSFIRINSNAESIYALTGKNTRAPHCPLCNKAEKQWRDKLTDRRLTCSSCGESSEPWRYNWRKSAGFARFFIEITEIYPQEAIPQPALLSALENISKTRWQYFYHYL